MSTRKIKRIKFLAIKKQLTETNRTQADIAADYEVGSSTVSVINAASTWGNYLAGMKALRPIRRNRAPSPEKAFGSHVEQAQAAGLNPQTAADRLEKKFSVDLIALEKRYQNENDSIHFRQDGALKRIVDVEDDTLRSTVVGLIAIFVAVVALGFSIIALVK